MKQIRQKQLRFLGHILREQTLESRVLTGATGRSRPKGRPRTTYMDGLIKALCGRYSKVGLLRSAYDREAWRFMVAKSKMIWHSNNNINTNEMCNPEFNL